jgi:hypothetical protein
MAKADTAVINVKTKYILDGILFQDNNLKEKNE